jgi:hypothetical protein
MRLRAIALIAILGAAGCASWRLGPGAPGEAAGLSPAPRPKATTGADEVGAAEFGALKVTRGTALRQEPATSARKFGALKAGDVVLRLEARGPWYRVWVPAVALSGWIERGTAAAAGKVDVTAASPVPVAELATVTVAKGGVRLRSAPSARADVIRQLEKGEPLRLLREQGTWVRVFDPATKGSGYISVQLIERAR